MTLKAESEAAASPFHLVISYSAPSESEGARIASANKHEAWNRYVQDSLRSGNGCEPLLVNRHGCE